MVSPLYISFVIYGLASCSMMNNENKFYDGDQEYGYVEVRKGAFMFWWLYYAGGDKNTAYEKPLVIWIQGGPGIPASGVGNFLELGPQDMYLQNRSYSWVHKRNVLFFDSPVGAGFSYVKNSSLLVKTDTRLAHDAVNLIGTFLKKFPGFQTVPTHIFSQSYGGKIAPRLAYYLHKRIKAGKMKMNLKTVGLGSAYVSPKFYRLAYSEYLYNLGFIDRNKREKLKATAIKIANACDQREYAKANELDVESFYDVLYNEDKLLNMYDVQKEAGTFTAYGNMGVDEKLESFMNNYVKHVLADVIPVDIPKWEFTKSVVYHTINNDMMRPSTIFVERLLNETNITIAVYNGQWDLITSIPGALEWVHRLKWYGAAEFETASREEIRGVGNGYFKNHRQLSFWWIYKAGHSIPSTNPEAMEHILSATVDSLVLLNTTLDITFGVKSTSYSPDYV